MEPPPDISNYSEEEQKILLKVFAKQQEEDDKDKIRDEQTKIKLLEAAISLRLQEKSSTDQEATCNICFKTKFADGIGHICNECQIRCCARCGVKVTTKSNKVWLCVVCRMKKELNIKYGKWMKKENPKASQWGRSRSLEEQARTERAGGMRKDYVSSLNINMSALPFWGDDKKQTPVMRSSPVAPVREELPPSAAHHYHHRPPAVAPELRYDPPPPGGNGNNRRHSRRRSSLDTIRNDSLSSDQSENPPRPPRPSRKGNGGGGGGGGHRYRRSGSSGSEDEARSSPSSCQDSESDRGPVREAPEPRRPHAPPRRRFEPPGGLTKDSGIDTSSSATLYEDLQKHSVYWKRSPDGTRYFGHMVLKKEYLVERMARQSLGMKVVGGQRVDGRTVGAIVENIREGEIADRIGRIERGDEVLEWNGRRLRGLSKEDVAELISESKNDPQVKLVICRKIGMDVSNPIDSGRVPPHLEVHPEAIQRGLRQESRYMRYPDRPASSYRTPVATIGGKIQIRLYFDTAKHQLIVTVVCATDLPPRSEGMPRNPYVKIVLLPDKSEKSKRRSKTIASTNDPQWHQSFVYTHLRQSELRNRTLQISVWDYDRKVAFSDFLGEVVIPLRSNLSGESQCYPLSLHREDPHRAITTSPPLLLSPTASRISDEELSDFDEKFSEHTVYERGGVKLLRY